MGYKVNKIYVGTTKVRPTELVLKQIFDFSTNDWKGYTMTPTDNANRGIAINTSGGYCYGVYGNPTGAGQVWKGINAKRYWGRIKFMYVTSMRGGISIGTFDVSGKTPNSQILTASASSSGISIDLGSGSGTYTTKASTSYSFSLNTYYYLDGKFDNGKYTNTLYDSNMNKLKEITYQGTETVWKYAGFCFRGGVNSQSCCRVYEYREAYDNN